MVKITTGKVISHARIHFVFQTSGYHRLVYTKPVNSFHAL